MENIDELLEHHGIKGMHWGVRKDRSTESGADRRASRVAVYKFSEMQSEKTANFWDSKVMSKEDYDKLSTAKEFVKKNTELNRITVTDSTVARGKTYVSQNKADSEIYKAILPAYGPSTKGGFGQGGQKKYAANYELTLKTTQKLTAPSEKERVDAFVNLMSNKTIYKSPKKPPITGREYLESLGYKRELKQLDDQQAGLAFYNRFVGGAGSDQPINSAYFDSLKAKGYNAVADDADKNVITKAPLILLDPEGTAVVTGVRKLTVDEINQAQRKLKVS